VPPADAEEGRKGTRELKRTRASFERHVATHVNVTGGMLACFKSLRSRVLYLNELHSFVHYSQPGTAN
jgi:hypothetical protein